MKTVGLITEYNPFHNGHLYHLNKSKEITNADFSIVVMSGNFVQRGEPAIVDKWIRTQMALNAGADLVLELPVVYATSSAEFFAFGAMSILHNSGIVDHICFGSEQGTLSLLSQVADFLYNEPKSFKENLRLFLSEGLPFPVARNKAVINSLEQINDVCRNEQEFNKILSSPNNILGIEYLKALKCLDSSIVPHTIERKGVSYHSMEIDSSIASATGIRNAFKTNQNEQLYKTMPKDCADLFMKAVTQGNAPIYNNDFSAEVQYILRALPTKHLQKFMEIEEGLENRIVDCGSSNYLIDDLVSAVKTKRYTLTRIQRALIHILLQISSKDFWEFHNNGGPQYIRILGFRKSTSSLLKNLKENSKLPIVSNIRRSYEKFDGLAKKMLETEIRATDIYSLHYPKISQRVTGKEFSSPLIILDK